MRASSTAEVKQFFNYFVSITYFDEKEVNAEYLELLEKVDELQQRCLKDISHQRYRMNQISGNIKR